MEKSKLPAVTPENVAEILCNDDRYNAVILDHLQEIDAAAVDDLTRGAVILGAEPIDYPLTDGITFYILRAAGDAVAISIDGDGDGVTIRTAPIE